MGKSQKSTTTQKNEPPAWAKPLLERGAGVALDLFNNGTGFGVYTGPTQAPLSSQTLGAMNAIMAATGGGGGGPITNDSINALIPQVSMDNVQKREPPAATAAPQSRPQYRRPLW